MNSSYLIDYQTPRENKGFTREDVTMLLADRGIGISMESLGCYERGVRDPSPSIVVELADIYQEPFLTQRYCKHNCAIGQAYSYEILDSVDMNLSNIALKLLEEHRESHNVLADTLVLITNKTGKKDFTENEINKLKTNIHELLDTEHTIEIFKIALNKFIDMKEIIADHNQKCRDRKYVRGL
ncbi:helix-turn-helix transcriptional regulator [Tissierella sp. Yu-01]|uniref:helix-turn-helix domain-containing protein n=1 Tax=Tissierella sp. Yu-01 TaxID=3035694 RepID=UPI00240D7A26|nr:helix-turn-helix transcriptional regulator [Tissierella sp. Yu-01]WFA10371.1 helix-turn-helix transcriptional regulator [Tissierella sp. Yu-01]